jgi:hypothetical protein
MLIAALEQGTDRRAWRCPTTDQISYIAQLRSWDYPLSDVEMLVLTTEPDPDQQAQTAGIAVPDTGQGMAA